MINEDRYIASCCVLKNMVNKGIITEIEYKKAEDYLAKKHCIKVDSLYRLNNLINEQLRAIYVVSKEEVNHGIENDNQNRIITRIEADN